MEGALKLRSNVTQFPRGTKAKKNEDECFY